MWKDLYNSFNMCVSMFTVIPTLKYDWDERLRDKLLAFLPIVGLFIGVIWLIFYFLLINILKIVNINSLYYVFAVLLSIFPMIISGFIHADGFMDVIDAICSNRDLEKRKIILKDSHVGSFAVIYFVIFFTINLLSFIGLMQIQNMAYFLILIFIPFFSRFMSSVSLFCFNKINESEYAYMLNTNTDNLKIYFAIIFCICFIINLFLNIKFIFVIVFEIIVHMICMLICKKSFGGINGDSSGFSIFVSEVLSIFAMSIIFNL